MDRDFLSLFDKSNSVINEETGEITIIVPLFEAEGQFKINSPCSITSKCDTLIKCELIEVLCASVSFSNVKIEGSIITVDANNFTFDNCTIYSRTKCADANIVINSSENVTITNSKFLDSEVGGLKINPYCQVKIDKIEISNTTETNLVIGQGCKVTLTNSHLHNTQSNGIYTNGPNTIEISNCIITDSQYPLMYVNKSKITIKNSTFKNCEQNGLSINTSPQVQIENNTFENIKSSAISISTDSHGIVNGNSFTKIGGNSIFTKLSDIEIYDNKMSDQTYPGIAITYSSTSKIYHNEIKDIKYNGIAIRNAKYAKIFENEIDSIGECAVSVSNTEKVEVENNRISNCDITSVESYNHSNTFVNNNIISNIGKHAFLCYTSGFMVAENNSIDEVKIAMTKLAFKGHGDFVNNKITNCPNQCEILTSSLYYFNKNGDFKGVTNNIEKVDDSIDFNEVKLNNSNVLCLKCNKNPRNCFLFECCHKIYCKKCADLALKNKEDCPLCRFTIEKVSEGYGMNSEDLCIICCENEPDSIILPCGHTGVCSSCLDTWYKVNDTCPCCRCESRNYKKIDNDI